MQNGELKVRLEPEVLARLEVESSGTGESLSALAAAIVDEGLRMRKHLGIVFRDGPSGRRPGVAGAADVWEIARLYRRRDESEDEALIFACQMMNLQYWQAKVAFDYYTEYRDEIDAWMDHNDRIAEEAEAEWRRQNSLVKQ
jgi:hypothetical protein